MRYIDTQLGKYILELFERNGAFLVCKNIKEVPRLHQCCWIFNSLLYYFCQFLPSWDLYRNGSNRCINILNCECFNCIFKSETIFELFNDFNDLLKLLNLIFWELSELDRERFNKFQVSFRQRDQPNKYFFSDLYII